MATEAKEARAKAEERAGQAEAQVGFGTKQYFIVHALDNGAQILTRQDQIFQPMRIV